MKKGLPTQLPHFLKIASYKNKEVILLLESSAISRSECLKNSKNIENTYHQINRANLSLKPGVACNQHATLLGVKAMFGEQGQAGRGQ